ncbi:MAG: chemotaxis protein [Verrucomicrobiales bacterium]|nr:chemotaxis protein [Verrucomicrobiales bacterium]
MKNLTVQKRIVYSYLALVLLFVSCSGYAYIRLKEIRARTADISQDAVPGIRALQEIQVRSLQNYALTCRRLLSENTQGQNIIQELRANKLRVEEEIEKFKKLTGAGEEQKLFQQMSAARSAYVSSGLEALTLIELGSTNEARTLITTTVKDTYEQFTVALDKLVKFNYDFTEQRDAEIVQAATNTASSIILLVVVGLILLALSGISLVRSITSPLNELVNITRIFSTGDFTQRVTLKNKDEFATVAEGMNRMADDLSLLVAQIQKSGIQVNNSTSSIAATSKQQQATAMEIASTTTEIGATSREISATSKELLRTVNEVTSVAEDTANRAASGQEGLNKMEETMRHVMEAAASINSKLATVNEKAGNINAVVITITKVADQTNLLSLNAAIEAEKAGEYGRGFSVVATEIRRLADQTAIATLDIEQIVKEMQSAVSAGVMGMDKFSEEVRRGAQEVHTVSAQLTQIIKLVQDLTPRFEAVNEGMQAQSTGAQQISEALSQLSESAQQTADSLKLSTQAVGQLTEASAGLRTGISRFKVEN